MKEQTAHPSHNEAVSEKAVLGFWIYLMTDLLMFSVLFACYAVLHDSTFGGPAGKEIFKLPLALSETLILLTSSFTCGIGMIFARQGEKVKTLLAFLLTFLLGISFLMLEFSEFSELFHEGNTYHKSAFLSSFFGLVGTHGLHIISGLIWIAILLIYILRKGVTRSAVQKLTLFSLFWHFLDIVWIFIFTIVYLFAKL